MWIPNLFDSHVHWAATGDSRNRLDLSHLKSESQVLQVQRDPSHFRSSWWVGFGWDQTHWPDKNFPRRETLDQLSTTSPIAFTRADGHAIWINSFGLMSLGLMDPLGRPTSKVSSKLVSSGQALLDENQKLSGVLLDKAMDLVLKALPPFSPSQIKDQLKLGSKYFNSQGYTHIRDLTCDQVQFQAALELFESQELNLAVEQFFHVMDLHELQAILSNALHARKYTHPFLRVKGIKVYYDGALGSEGALLSQPYGCSCSRRGFSLMSKLDLAHVMSEVWGSGLELAVHAIGDEAAHHVIQVARSLWDKGYCGHLHVEHLQLARLETLSLLAPQDPITFHMQPCHWLSDRRWAREKLGLLFEHLFQWAALERSGHQIYFGSDSPIEMPSLENNLHAIQDLALHGIQPPKKDMLSFHSHPDLDWVRGCRTYLDGTRVTRVQFMERDLL